MSATIRPARALLDTPKRVVGAYEELYRGYRECPPRCWTGTFSETGNYDDLVLVRDIAFNSHCEHHMMPFTGKAHVAYMPVDKVVGLSKLARLVDVYARRLQTQEHMTAQIATAIDEILKPRGVAVMIEAEHTCMSLRGVEKPGALTVTTQFRGVVPRRSERAIALHLDGARQPALDRDDFSSNRHPDLVSCLSMIFSENRCTLFGIML